MNYIITGGAGNISKPVAEKLIAAGHTITVIGRSAANVESLTSLGAKAAIGSVEDENFIAQTFKGADAVYLMIPPNFSVEGGWIAYQNKVADAYVNAIQKNGVKHVVVLSSVGAHMGRGAGPVDGLADMEKKLSVLTTTNIKILRPGYFMYNLMTMIPLIKNMNIIGSNFGDSEEKLAMADTQDIAEAAADELLNLSFTGISVRYIASDERHPNEIAEVLSKAIGKPGLPWVVFSDEQTKAGILQMGLPPTIAEGYTQLGEALRSGAAQADYWKNKPTLGKTKLENFAKTFAAAFAAS
jgi:uncharacterized protein YbjT (DUF2867 family)